MPVLLRCSPPAAPARRRVAGRFEWPHAGTVQRAGADPTRRNRWRYDDPTNGFFDFSAPHLLQAPQLPTQPTNGTCDPRLESHPYSSTVSQRKGKGLRELRMRRPCYWQKLSEASASQERLPLFLLGGFLRGLLLRCHWVILLSGTFSLEG